MILRTSLFKKGLIISDIKRFWWVSVLYAIGLFFVLPFNLLMQGIKWKDMYDNDFIIRNLDIFSSGGEMQVLFICIVPVVLAVLLFRYLQVERSSSLMHSLPCRRRDLYASHSLTGVMLFTAPILFIGLLLVLFQALTFLGEYMALVDVLIWIALTLLFNTLFFFFAVFVGMFTGNSIAQIVFVYILHILPAVLYEIVGYNIEKLLFGYPGSLISTNFVSHLPLVFLLNNRLAPDMLSPGQVIGYVIATIVFLAAAAYAYKIRDVESAGDLISFAVIKPVFKYGVTICCTLVGGAYFARASEGSIPLILTGYVFCSLLGYVVSEMLIQKSFKVWHSYKGYVVYLIIMLVAFTGITADVFGYVKHVPEPGQVENVYFGYNSDDWLHIEKLKDVDEFNRVQIGPDSYNYYSDMYFFESGYNIRSITNLHRHLVENPQKSDGRFRYIIYTLKNGGYLMRRYCVDEIEHAAYLKPVYESMEYKASRFPVIEQNPQEIKTIEINDERSHKKGIILTDEGEIREFAGLLARELVDADYEELVLREHGYMVIRITENEQYGYSAGNGRTHRYELRMSYSSVLDWLKEKGYYEKFALLSDEIEYVSMEREDINGIIEKYPPVTMETAAIPGQEEGAVIIKETHLIEELLNMERPYRSGRYKDRIWIRFYLKEQPEYPQYETYIYSDTPVSPELKVYIDMLGE
ncbi:MAG: DUF6449 domain-containing protein [Acetivibrionales bacterium]